MNNIFLPKQLVRGGLRKWLEVGIDMPKPTFSGHFKVELVHRSGFIVRTLEFDNMITDAGLDYIASQTTLQARQYAAMGTGGTTPSTSDTGLVAEISPSSTNRKSTTDTAYTSSVYTAGPPDYHTRTCTYTFDFSQANGNLTEIGLFSANSGGTMWTRQLLKDGGGSPTTITKTTDYQLIITYSIRMNLLQSDVTSSITISGSSYATTIRGSQVSGTSGPYPLFLGFGPSYLSAGMDAYHAGIGIRTSVPSGTAIDPTSSSKSVYAAGNKYYDVTSTWGAAIANVSGIGAVDGYRCYPSSPMYQIGFSPTIPKDATKQLVLTTRCSWDRV